MQNNKLKFLGLLTLISFAFSNVSNAQSWGDVAFSGTLNANELCYTDGKDINCDAGLLVNDPSATLIVPGSVSATAFVGDGSGLTNVTASSVTLTLNDLTDAYRDTENMNVGSIPTSITTAVKNVAYGVNSLSAVTSGSDNTAIGHRILRDNTTGQHNTGVGSAALMQNTTGSYNVAVGSSVLYDSNGDRNTGVGFLALRSNEGGGSNSGLGYAALRQNTSGNYNTGMGYDAVKNNTSGDYNTGFGYKANSALTSGSNNLALGALTDVPNTSGSNQLNIANAIYGADVSNTGISKIGINIPVPTESLEVSGTVSATAFVGDGSGLTNLSGGSSIFSADTSVSIIDSGVGEVRLDVDGENLLTATQGNFDVSGNFTFGHHTGDTLIKAGNGDGVHNLVIQGALNDNTAQGGNLILKSGSDKWGRTPATLHLNGSTGGGTTYLHAGAAHNNSSGQRIEIKSGSGGINANKTGGDLLLYAGNGGGSPSNGGDVYITGGSASGAGIDGDVILGINYGGLGTTIGNVGVHTTSPASALEVSGTVSATAFVGDGSGLTNVAGGLWTDNTDYINYDGMRIYKAGTTWNHSFGDTGVFYHADKSAYRIGRQNNGSGDEANVGIYSFGMGDAVVASGLRSFAMGNTSTASGNDSFAFGNGSQATGARAIAMGDGARALNSDAIAIGSGTYASNLFSIALGRNASSGQNSAFAVGNGTRAAGNASVAMGMGSKALNSYSLATNYQTIANGANAVAMGKGAQANGITSFAFGEGVIAQGNYSYVIGLDNSISGTTVTDARTMAILGGEVGIGLTSPSVELDVSGSIQYTGDLLDASDKRLKQNIQPLETGELNRLNQVNPVSFEMKDRPGVKEFGVIAQDFENVYPELVKTANDDMGTKSVNYIGLIAPMVKAIQEQQVQIEVLKQEIEMLKSK